MKTYSHKATEHPHLFRVVDRKGDWTHYYDDEHNAYLRSSTYILARGYAKPELLEYAKNHTREEIDAKLQIAGDRGDAIHQVIRLILEGEQCDRHTKVLAENNTDYRELTDEEWDGILSFERWMAAHAPKIIASERTVRNVADGYAGTLDVIFRITKACGAKCCNCAAFVGKIVLGDWKTSRFGDYNGIYDSFGPQVASYAAAELSHIIGSHSIEATAIVRLGTAHKSTGGYECQFYGPEESNIHLKEFMAAKTIADASYRPFDPVKEIRDIPETITIAVEREDLTPVITKRLKFAPLEVKNYEGELPPPRGDLKHIEQTVTPKPKRARKPRAPRKRKVETKQVAQPCSTEPNSK